MLFSEEINTFLAVVRTGSLLQAAEIVCATQSTVSYRIQALERRIGHSLLLRSRGSRRIALTPHGERFLDIAERWKRLEMEAEQLKMESDRYLAIGAVDAVAIHVLPPFVSELSREDPPIRLHLESGRYWQLANRVASGHLNAAFTLSPADHADLVSTRIRSYAMRIAYMPQNGEQEIEECADLTSFDYSREVYLPWSGQFDLWRTKRGLLRPLNSADKSHLLAPLLKRPGAWALVPSFMVEALRAQTGCSIHRLAHQPPPDIALYRISRRHDSTFAERDSEAVERALRALQA
ncbi:LysR family transcriptional regulator [Trinickia sp. EG282A]|uniref:LysR family transcriptional regulator n=1 Tax=Trinickia sp. EG282A TaxID=3237013 RepID=UPI0034D31C9C